MISLGKSLVWRQLSAALPYMRGYAVVGSLESVKRDRQVGLELQKAASVFVQRAEEPAIQRAIGRRLKVSPDQPGQNDPQNGEPGSIGYRGIVRRDRPAFGLIGVCHPIASLRSRRKFG